MKNSNKTFRFLALPYTIWLFILVIIPILIMFFLSFMTSEGTSLDGAFFSLDNFKKLFEPSVKIAFWNSIKFATLATIICAVLGYIIAYTIFKSGIKNKFTVLTIIILPMWSNLLLRGYAFSGILREENILRNLLSKIGINYQIAIIGTQPAVLLGLIFSYLPFMVLPIYTALEKIDFSLEEAALDLGVTETKKFWKVIFPLSLKGIFSGAIMVFLPCASGFAIPKIMGEGNILLIGSIIETSFLNMDYNFGSLLAIIILIVILGAIWFISKIDSEGETFL